MRLLARREHSARELAHKLAARGCAASTIDELLQALRQEGLQSDARFAESHARSRVERGYGPLKIRAELAERGVDEGLIEEALAPWSESWMELARGQWQKRFGQPPADRAAWAKQARFLQGRGFPSGLISRLMNEIERDTE
ncbi:MAG: regulatory protein RecX [Gammaproteobacteria bacterium]|nr:MAG: regulatory protein RecX [Gammaproteobacteria bacterium]